MQPIVRSDARRRARDDAQCSGSLVRRSSFYFRQWDGCWRSVLHASVCVCARERRSIQRPTSLSRHKERIKRKKKGRERLRLVTELREREREGEKQANGSEEIACRETHEAATE